jgi:molecular chaperone GrpE
MDPSDGRLATLTEEVTQLRDLFQRRLFEDKAKNKLYDELYEQLRITRGALAEQLFAPLFRELLLVVDRVASLARDGDIVLESVSDELLELLERRGVRAVPTTTTFDPAIHEAVRIDPREDRPPGTILEMLRPGYLLGTQLLRAERVVVAAASSSAAETTTEAASEVTGPELDVPEQP